MHRLVFEAHGAVAEAVSDDEALFAQLPEVLPPGWAASTGEPQARIAVLREGTVTVDGELVARSGGEPDRLLIRFGSVVRHHMALLSPEHVFIHAGVVSVDSKGIVIPGASRSGKTSLVDELVRAGATYYSDEFAVVDADGLIHPYAKPLSIRDSQPGPGWPVPVPEAQLASSPLRAELIIVTSYEEGAEWRPQELTAGEGAMALLQNAVAARTRPAHVLAAVGRLARAARVLAGPRGEARDVARALAAEGFDSRPVSR